MQKHNSLNIQKRR